MYLSQYCRKYSYPEKPGHFLLFSTKNMATILLKEEVFEKIKQGKLSTSVKKSLVQLGFLVPDLQKEKEGMKAFLDRANKIRRKSSAIVVMNLDCNLNCGYCFEGMLKGRRYMSTETADLLVDYVSRKILPGKKSFNMDFYGGEPLMSMGMIKRISRKIKAKAEKRGVEYTFGMVSNGTLLTRKRVEELVPLGFKKVQITLDGPKEFHDLSRPYRKGRGSFDRIIRNVKECCELVGIQIGGNFTQKNYEEFPRLLDHLMQEGITPNKIPAVKFAPVTKNTGEHALPDYKEGCESVNEPWLKKADLFLRKAILERGFKTPKMRPSPCMIEFDDDMVVNYDGTLYKCPAFIGRKGLDTGHIRDGMEDYRESHNMDFWKKEECLECEYLPLCFGGCRYLKLVRDGNFDDVDCKKTYLDANLEGYIRQDIQYSLK